MALEWSTDINFAGLFKRKPRAKTEYPSKTYINLIVPDEREIRGVRSIIGIALGVIALVLFGKFGVYDYFAKVAAKNAELVEKSEYLSNLNLQLGDYDDVLETYRTYEAARMTDEAGDVPAVDAFDLADRRVLPMAQIDSFLLKDNVLTMELSNIDLDKVGQLVASLYEEKMVVGVRVTTASSAADKSEEKKKVTLTISLRTIAEANAEEAKAQAESEASGRSDTASNGE